MPVLRVPREDVEMRPGFRLLHETLEEQGSRHRAGEAVGRHIVDIGDLGGKLRLVGLPQRHAPDRIANREGCIRQRIRQRVVIRIEWRQVRTERDACCSGQRRHVDQERGLLVVGKRQGVGKHETALGIGIADLDRDALAAGQHVAGPERIAGDGVLDRGNEHAQTNIHPRSHDHLGKAKHVGRATHVLLHVEHAARRLDVEAAGIETHTLADQRHLRCILRSPSEVDQPWRPGGRATDRVDHWKIALQQRVSRGDLHDRAIPGGEIAGGGLEGVGAHVTGRRVDEIAHQRHRAGHALDPVDVDAVGHGEANVPAGRAAVPAEDISAEGHGKRCEFAVLRRRGEMPVALGQVTSELAGYERRIDILARSGSQKRTDHRPVRSGDRQHTAGLAGKPVRLRPAHRGWIEARAVEPVPRYAVDRKRGPGAA